MKMREIRQSVDFRDSTEIVFLSPGGFRGNSKYLFLMMSLDESFRQRVLWLTESPQEVCLLQNAGLHAHLWSTTWGHNNTWAAVRSAKIVVADDLFGNHAAFPFIREHNQKVRFVQLWHGGATKSTGEDFLKAPSNFEHFEKISNELYCRGDFISATYANVENDVKNWPNMKVHHLPEPKMEAFVQDKASVTDYKLLGTDLGAVEFAVAGGSPAPVLLVPSYTENSAVKISDIVKALDKELKKASARAILKLHHHQAIVGKAPLHGEFSQRLYIADSNSDVYPLIQVCSGLITDYSSLGVEAKLNGWPFALWDVFGEVARSGRPLSPEMIDLRALRLCRNLSEALLAIEPIRSQSASRKHSDLSGVWLTFISRRLKTP